MDDRKHRKALEELLTIADQMIEMDRRIDRAFDPLTERETDELNAIKGWQDLDMSGGGRSIKKIVDAWIEAAEAAPANAA